MRYYMFLRRRRKRSRRGQGITEYGAMLAFVCLLAALGITFAHGSLGPALSAAYSSVVSALNGMTKSASAAGS